jgi:hypothetical protein
LILWSELSEGEKRDIAEFFLTNKRSYDATFGTFDVERTASSERKIRQWAAKLEGVVAESETPRYDQQVITVEAPTVVVIGDLEIPDHDADILNRACQIGKKFKADTLILNGDLIAADACSTHRQHAGITLSANDELDVAESVIGSLSKHFKHIYALSGNHDKRWRWFTNGQFTVDRLIPKFFKDITFSPFSRLNLISAGVPWLICHPRQYSKVPGSVARDIAEIEDTNVVAAHMHLLSWSITKNGKYIAVDGGSCRDANRTAYKVEDVVRFPRWCVGFTVIKDGYPYLFSSDKTDWNYWLK